MRSSWRGRHLRRTGRIVCSELSPTAVYDDRILKGAKWPNFPSRGRVCTENQPALINREASHCALTGCLS